MTAWCSVPYYTTFEVEATTLGEALAEAKRQARRECGEPCGGGESEWNEFEITSDGDASQKLRYLEPSRLAENAVAVMLAALCRFETAWRAWAADTRRYPKLAAACEMFSIYEQARAAIREATEQ